MEFQENIQFKTRNNTDVRVDHLTTHSITGAYRNGANWIEAVWDESGSFMLDGSDHPLDIIFDNSKIKNALGRA